MKEFLGVLLLWGCYHAQQPLPPFGSQWFTSDSAMNVTVKDQNGVGPALVWDHPKHPTVLLTYLPEAYDLEKIPFNVTMRWKSDGTNKCDPYDWEDHKHCSCDEKIKETCKPGKGTPSCARTSVNCLEGTGDFRIAMWDTKSNNAPRVDKDGFAGHLSYDDLGKYLRDHFSAYRGYNFRIDPHVSTVYHHPKGTEPGGFYPKYGPDPFDSKHRITVYSGFEAPRGLWTTLSLEVEKKSSSEFRLRVQMGKVKYTVKHTWPTDEKAQMPRYVDSIGIWFPNGRDYTTVQMAPLSR